MRSEQLATPPPDAHLEPVRLEDVAAEAPEDERVTAMLAHSIDVSVFAPAVEAQDPPDAADTLETLDVDDAADVVFRMTDEAAARDLAEMHEPLAVMLLEDLADEHGPAEPARYLGLMEPDDAVDLLQAMPGDLRERILAVFPGPKAVQLEQLSAYDPETAGGLMTLDFAAVPTTATKIQAVDILRSDLSWEFNHVYCVDDQQRLEGVVSLRQLLICRADQPLRELMRTPVDVVHPDLDREEIAAAFERYEYTTLPVVDLAHRLLGVVTVDDVLEVIREEATEDAYRMVGAGKGEAVYTGIRAKLMGRFPWLLVNLFTSFLAAFVVLQFNELIEQIVVLAVLMPVIANQAGNAGQQSLAVTLRGLVLGEIRSGRVWPLIWRELALGLVTGALVGVIVGAGVALMAALGLVPNISWRLGIVVALAMTGSLGVGCLVGTAMPVVMERLKRDPATASTIFLTMATDTVSFLTFLGLASVFRTAIVGGP